jgi:hypothetical protein
MNWYVANFVALMNWYVANFVALTVVTFIFVNVNGFSFATICINFTKLRGRKLKEI